MLKKIGILLFCITLSGCSFIPRFTFDTKGTTPQETVRTKDKFVCKGETKLNEAGDIIYCSKGYFGYVENYNKAERKYTIWEKWINFQRNLAGWGIPLFILACAFIPGFGGAILGFVGGNILSIPGKGFKLLVKGIQKGKQYVRSNGTKYSEEERKVYQAGADDMLNEISKAIKDPKVLEKINIERAKISEEK